MPPIPSVSSSIPFKATHIRSYKNLELVEMFEVKKRQAWAGVFPFFCSIPLSFCLSLQQGRQMRRIRANNGCQTQKPWIHTCICTGANHSFSAPSALRNIENGLQHAAATSVEYHLPRDMSVAWLAWWNQGGVEWRSFSFQVVSVGSIQRQHQFSHPLI